MDCFERIEETSGQYEKNLRKHCLASDHTILEELSGFPFIKGYCGRLASYWKNSASSSGDGSGVYIHLYRNENGTGDGTGEFNIKSAIATLKKEIKDLEIYASEFIIKDDENAPKRETEEAQKARGRRIGPGSTQVPQAIQRCLSPEAFKAARYLLAHWESLESKLTTDQQ